MNANRRLRVERPCQVRHGADGQWGWHCWLCPLPLRPVTSSAASWRSAFDEAERHVRFEHEIRAESGSRIMQAA